MARIVFNYNVAKICLNTNEFTDGILRISQEDFKKLEAADFVYFELINAAGQVSHGMASLGPSSVDPDAMAFTVADLYSTGGDMYEITPATLS